MRRCAALGPLLLGACTALAPAARTDLAMAPTPAGNASIEAINPASGAPQGFTPGAQVPPAWWHGFASPALDALVAQALVANNDIATADANLRAARALAGVAGAAQFPQVDASYQPVRARISDTIATPLADPSATLYTLHTAQVTVSYPLDLFGGVATKVRSARFGAVAAQFRTKAARGTVVANLVLAAVNHAALVEQLAAAQEAVRANREVLALLRRRRELGALGSADVAAQEAALATAEGAVPALERSALHGRAVIAALIGQAPGSALPPLPSLAELAVPRDLPVSLPSQLVVERPDVRAAQAAMQGAAMDVGSAIAARLPAITLTANAGGGATAFSELFVPGNLFWQVAGGLTQPLFHGAALLNQQRAARAALDAAKAQYRAAVLQAFVDVSDALAGLHGDARALDAAARADNAAARTLGYTLRQLELGAVGRVELLNAQSARAAAAGTLVQARAARLTDTVALYQALGGGAVGK